MTRQFAAVAVIFALLAVVLPDTSPTRLANAADHPIPEPLKKAPPSKFECHWADTSITIDGKADEPAWKHAQEITAFHLPWLGEKARMARTPTPKAPRNAPVIDHTSIFHEMDSGDARTAAIIAVSLVENNLKRLQ